MITINGEHWRAVLVPPYHPQLRRSDGSTTLGACDDNEKTIYIDETVNDHYLKKVLCHELTHAAMFSYNIDLSYEQEEVVADIIATYGADIIDMTNTIFNRLRNQR